MTLIQPKMATAWGKTLVQGYHEGGILPKWPLASSYTGCMVGYPATSVLADLICKNLAEGDMAEWAEAAERSSVYREDLAEKFKGTRELDLITRHIKRNMVLFRPTPCPNRFRGAWRWPTSTGVWRRLPRRPVSRR